MARHHRRQVGAVRLHAARAADAGAVSGDLLQAVRDHRQHALGLPERRRDRDLSASIRTRRCTTCAAPCRRSIRARAPRRRRARNLAARCILQSFYALRETFLEELDLEAPDHPLLISGGRRSKASGATRRARRAQERQRHAAGSRAVARCAHRRMLAELYDKEKHDRQALAPARQPMRPVLSSERPRMPVPGALLQAHSALRPGMTGSAPRRVNTGSARAACFFCSDIRARRGRR